MQRTLYLATLVAVATVLVLVLCSNAHAQESFQIVRESCVYNTATRQYVFNIYFNVEPDFYTTAWNHNAVYQHHDFRYKIDFVRSWPEHPTATRKVLASYACSTSALLVTDFAVPFPIPLDTIGFKVYPTQKRVSFVVSAELMGGEGTMYYLIETIQYGSTTQWVFGQARVKVDIALPVEHTTWGRIKEMYGP